MKNEKIEWYKNLNPYFPKEGNLTLKEFASIEAVLHLLLQQDENAETGTKEDLSGRSSGQTPPLVSTTSRLRETWSLLDLLQVLKSKLSQRRERRQNQRRLVKQDETLNSLSIEQSQGPLLPPKGLSIIF